MANRQQQISQYVMAASFGLLFAGVSGLAGYMGLNEKAMVGVGLGLVAAGLALSLAAVEFLRNDNQDRR